MKYIETNKNDDKHGEDVDNNRELMQTIHNPKQNFNRDSVIRDEHGSLLAINTK